MFFEPKRDSGRFFRKEVDRDKNKKSSCGTAAPEDDFGIKLKTENLQKHKNLLQRAINRKARAAARGSICTDGKTVQQSKRRTQGGSCVTIRRTDLNFYEMGLKKPYPGIFTFHFQKGKKSMYGHLSSNANRKKGILSEEIAESGFGTKPASATGDIQMPIHPWDYYGLGMRIKKMEQT